MEVGGGGGEMDSLIGESGDEGMGYGRRAGGGEDYSIYLRL